MMRERKEESGLDGCVPDDMPGDTRRGYNKKPEMSAAEAREIARLGEVYWALEKGSKRSGKITETLNTLRMMPDATRDWTRTDLTVEMSNLRSHRDALAKAKS
jgi:hypothetical protein